MARRPDPPKPFPRDDGRIVLGTRADRDRKTLYLFVLASGRRCSVAATSPEAALVVAREYAAAQGDVVISTP